MEKQVKGVAHAAFNVSDMDKAVQFYHDVFGFEKAFEMAHPVTGEPWIVYLHAVAASSLNYSTEGLTLSNIRTATSVIPTSALRLLILTKPRSRL